MAINLNMPTNFKGSKVKKPNRKKKPLSVKAAPNKQVFSGLSNAKTAAKLYADSGLFPLPLAENSAVPLIKKWTDESLSAADVLTKFTSSCDIALRLGPTSGNSVDVDLDSDVAVRLAPKFLPDTRFVFGRDSRPSSHRVYRVAGILPKRIFKSPIASGERSYVELRPDKCHVRVPPSIHHKDGQQLRFEPGKAGLPSNVGGDELQRCLTHLAITCLVIEVWPDEAGVRNELALALAGGLLRADLSTAEVKKIIINACREAGDEEWQQRAVSVVTTAKKLASNKPISGWPRFSNLLGPDGISSASTIQKWLRPNEKPTKLADILVTANELISSALPPRECIVEPWLHVGAIVLVFAQAKVGKTWWAQDLATSVAKGTEFLEYEISSARKVLYVDAEMTPVESQERLDALAAHTDNLILLEAQKYAENFDEPLDVTKENCQRRLDEVIEGLSIELVIIDPISMLAPRGAENDNASPELRSLLHWTFRLKGRGVSSVLVHHAGHSGEHARGASALEAAVNTVVALRKLGESGRVEMEFTHTRDKRPDPDKIRFQIADHGDAVSLDVFQNTKAAPEHSALPVILEKKPKTQKELAGMLGKTPSTISGWINKLCQQGLIQKKPLSLTKKGKEMAKQMV